MGVGLACFVPSLSWRWRGYAAAASLLACVTTAFGIELGQVFLPGKFPDTTDWFLESTGGLLGYAVFRMIHRRLAAAPQRRAAPRRHGSGRERNA